MGLCPEGEGTTRRSTGVTPLPILCVEYPLVPSLRILMRLILMYSPFSLLIPFLGVFLFVPCVGTSS